jgi:hypothetical protein
LIILGLRFRFSQLEVTAIVFYKRVKALKFKTKNECCGTKAAGKIFSAGFSVQKKFLRLQKGVHLKPLAVARINTFKCR